MNMKSTTSGMSGETSKTVPSAHGMDHRSVELNNERVDNRTENTQAMSTTTQQSEDSMETGIDMEQQLQKEQDKGNWTTVKPGKGFKPTFLERAYNTFTTNLSLSGGGQEP